jgi:RND family efflux transporter, MFP subunit
MLVQALGGLLALVIMSLSGGCKEAEKSTAAPEPPEVQVTQVIQKDVSLYSEWVGTTVGYITSQIRAQVSGALVSQNYKEGTLVKTGDLLFQIDPRSYQNAVDEAKAKLRQAEAQLEQIRAQLDGAKAQVEQAKAQVAQASAAVARAEAQEHKTALDVARYTPLAKTGSVSQQELDDATQNNLSNKAQVTAARANVEVTQANMLQAQANAKQAQANVAKAQADVGAAKASLDEAQLNLSFTKIICPIDGIAGIKNIDLGDIVNQNQTVLTTVSTVDPLYVQFQISEQEYLRFKDRIASDPTTPRAEDIPIEIILSDGTVYPHRGKLVILDREVGVTTGTFRARSEFQNPGNFLRPGQFAKVRAAISVKRGAFLVPQRAVQDLQGLYQVGVVGSDGKVDMRSVKAGEQIGSLWIIDAGLKPEERVIVEGLQKVRSGEAVKATLVTAESGGERALPMATSTKNAPAQAGTSPRSPSH